MSNDDELLIAAVRARSSIYDRWDRLHHNRNFINNAWEEIAQELGSDAVTCRNRWGTIRDYFVRKHRQASLGKPGRKVRWHLYQHLTFLGPLYDKRAPLVKTEIDDEFGEAVEPGEIEGDFNSNVDGSFDTSIPNNDVMVIQPESEETNDNETSGITSENGQTAAATTRTRQSPTDSLSSEEFIDNAPVTFKMPPPSKRKRRAEKEAASDMMSPPAVTSLHQTPSTTTDFLDKSIVLVKTLRESEVTDDNELFFKSLLPSLSRLDHVDVMEFRLDVQSLLLKYLKKSSSSPETKADETNNPQSPFNETNSMEDFIPPVESTPGTIGHSPNND